MFTSDCYMACLSAEDIQVFCSPEKYVTTLASLSVAEENDQNLTAAKKELLLLYFIYGHAHLSWNQSLTAHSREKSDPIITTKNKGVSTTLRKILCAACQFGKGK